MPGTCARESARSSAEVREYIRRRQRRRPLPGWQGSTSHRAIPGALGGGGCGGDADFSGLEQADAKTDARSAAGRKWVCASFEQSLPNAATLGFFLHPLAGGGEIELYRRGDFLAFENFGGGFEIFETRVHARDEIGLLDWNSVLFHLGQ